jgi:hypothetical protein
MASSRATAALTDSKKYIKQIVDDQKREFANTNSPNDRLIDDSAQLSDFE